MKFKIGQKVEHVLHGEWLLVIEYDESGGYFCRTKSLDIRQFEEFELREVINNG